jgi:phosphoribosylamine---glycine ligase
MVGKNFLFVTKEALITDIAWRIQQEGNEVKYFIECKGDKDIGEGFVKKVDDWKIHVDWADVIIFDDVLGQGTIAQQLREQGKAVVGGTPYTDKLEDDRSFGQEELRKHGIQIIPYSEFSSFDDAINYVKQNPAKYVIKPSGEAQNRKGLLFVGQEDDGADVIRVLEAYKRTVQDKVAIIQLQRRIAGVEVAVGAFFNGKEFMYPVNVNFEHKKLFPGNIGPSTGEMGTSMFWSMPNKIFNSTLKKMEETFLKEGFVGYMDLNCIVNNNGIYPLEFTARFGYPTIFIQQEGIVTPMGELFHGMATGTMKEFKTKKGFQVGVRIVVPPFPFGDKETFESHSKGSTIVFKKNGKEGVHIEDVKLVNGEWVVAGESGVILVVVGTGQTMKETQKQVYSRINNILIPHMYYRKDIGDRWFDDSDKLHNWGYLREQ